MEKFITCAKSAAAPQRPLRQATYFNSHGRGVDAGNSRREYPKV